MERGRKQGGGGENGSREILSCDTVWPGETELASDSRKTRRRLVLGKVPGFIWQNLVRQTSGCEERYVRAHTVCIPFRNSARSKASWRGTWK